MDAVDRAALADLVRGQRQAALGTLADGAPFVSMALYALAEPEAGAACVFLIHVSRLAPHTRHLEADPRASLLICQPNTGAGDPQALPRVTIQATAQVIPRESAAYAAGRAAYLARFPQAEMLFTFPDFALFRLDPRAARYVGGFAKAFSLDAEQLQQALG